ncbi:hypothetical protein TNCV_2665291 [Trichonephila clavipes]|nr:hypothetical protein TNCV_2665291 [Trichonephila clavipes]
MFNNCRAAWSTHTPDSIVLGGVMNLLKREEFFILEKESLLYADLRPVSKVFSIFGGVRVFFFSERLDFSQLASLQSKLRFCFSPHYLSLTPMP